jgi:hypothetical protein
MKKSVLMIILTFVLFLFTGGAGEDCPKGNVITKMDSSSESFKAVLPLDFSTVKSAGAMLNKAGTKLSVSLSNADFPISAMANDFILPIKSKDQFIAEIEFTNGKDKILPGTYEASSGYGKPFWVYAEIKLHKEEKGVIVSLGVREGTATIIKMTDTMICGKFDLRTKADSGVKGFLSGEFNCKLEKSRW